MATCRMQQKVWDYLSQTVSPDEALEIQTHIQDCAECQAFVQESESLEAMLAKRERPAPSADLLNVYHRELQAQFGGVRVSVFERIREFFSGLSMDSHRMMRFAPALGTLVIGLALGVWISRSGQPAGEATQVVVVPIEQEEHQFVTQFFGETELWMHQVLDMDTTLAGTLRMQSLSRQLLNQLRMMHDQHWVAQDTALVNYLTEVEMILMDLSNCEVAEADSTMFIYKETIGALDMLYRNERLRQRVTRLSAQI